METTKVAGSSGRITTLASRGFMLQQLLSVNDNSHAQQHLYPMMLQHAGRELVAEGVVMMLVTTIHDYVERSGLMPGMENLLLELVPNYIDALVANEEVAKEANAFLEECRRAARD